MDNKIMHFVIAVGFIGLFWIMIESIPDSAVADAARSYISNALQIPESQVQMHCVWEYDELNCIGRDKRGTSGLQLLVECKKGLFGISCEID